MMPIAPLMIEHRLIERMIGILEKESAVMETTGKADPELVEGAVDFIRTYADLCHHGKEEDILFESLAGRQLSETHRAMIDELTKEHVEARKRTGDLLHAKEAYVKNREIGVGTIVTCIRSLTGFYPAHIEKEDRHFFLPCMEYFTKEEQDDMLRAFQEFDKNLIHTKYKQIVEKLEAGNRR